MTLEIFAAAVEKRSLPPYTRVRWRGMVRCGALETSARNSMVVERSFVGPLYASTPIAYGGPVYERADVSRWLRDRT